MKKLLFALCLISSAALAVRPPAAQKAAAQPAASPSPSPAAAVVQVPKSVYPAGNLRNPFWPIGWIKPDATESTAVAAAPILTPASFTLSSVIGGAGSRFAILNGKAIEEGQQFGLQANGQVIMVTVQAIEDGQIILAYKGGQVVVPLRRH
jgi:hypothetical protein